MKAKRRIPVPVIVALGYSVLIACGLLLAFVLGQLPSREQSCQTECLAKRKSWRLLGKYPAHMVQPAKNPLICECY
jgi:hypothetical protein